MRHISKISLIESQKLKLTELDEYLITFVANVNYSY